MPKTLHSIQPSDPYLGWHRWFNGSWHVVLKPPMPADDPHYGEYVLGCGTHAMTNEHISESRNPASPFWLQRNSQFQTYWHDPCEVCLDNPASPPPLPDWTIDDTPIPIP